MKSAVPGQQAKEHCSKNFDKVVNENMGQVLLANSIFARVSSGDPVIAYGGRALICGRVTYPIELIGRAVRTSLGNEFHWCWWYNAYGRHHVSMDDAAIVHQYGLKHNIELLRYPFVNLDKPNAPTASEIMTYVSVICNSKPFYVLHAKDGLHYFLVKDAPAPVYGRGTNEEVERIMRRVILNNHVRHRWFVSSFLNAQEYHLKNTRTGFIATRSERDIITVDFCRHGNVSNFESLSKNCLCGLSEEEIRQLIQKYPSLRPATSPLKDSSRSIGRTSNQRSSFPAKPTKFPVSIRKSPISGNFELVPGDDDGDDDEEVSSMRANSDSESETTLRFTNPDVPSLESPPLAPRFLYEEAEGKK